MAVGFLSLPANLCTCAQVMVQDNEDLLSPNYRTLKVIRQVRKEGCRSYFLLFANGIQLARLFRFGDS